MSTIAIPLGAAALAAALLGCQDAADGLPPATAWQPVPAAGAPATSGANPHAGLAMATPAGGAGANPHAGLAMAPPAGGAPHGAIGTDVSKLGLPPPDPARALDPSHRVRGVIRAGGGLASPLRDGAAVFVVVKRDDRGKPAGPALAVQKLTWRPGLPFELTERQAMIAGTQLVGDVIVTARYDQDGDALTKQAGDVTGQARVQVPADAVAIALDTVLP